MQLFPPSIPLSKRLIDLLITIPLLVLASPLLTVLALLIWIKQGRPILFRQARPGLKGKIFTIYKFRTMREQTDKNGKPLPDAMRLTRLGKFMRATSLDELPELFNILKGDMSWVGPRPLLVAYLDRYTAEQARRHDVVPGITGWAQVNGRNTLSWEDKFKFDVWYVDHWSLGLDIKIMVVTVLKTIKQEGITQPGEATAKEFMGTENRVADKDNS